jgi:Zn-dependent metalloprotease
MPFRKIILTYFVLVFATISAVGQNVRLKDSVMDEEGNLRYFALNTETSVKRQADALNVLASVFKATGSTNFKLLRTKKRDGNRISQLFQQTFNTIPIYDCYYYLHFRNDSLLSANGEYRNVDKISNSIAIDSITAKNKAIEIGVSDKLVAPPTKTHTELIIWRSDKEKTYKYVFKVQVIYPDAAKSKEYMVDAATGNILLSVPLICSTNTPCTGTTLYSSTRNFTGDTYGGNVRLRENRNGVSISTLNNQNNPTVNAIDFTNSTTSWTSSGVNAGALDVHFATEQFLDYFKNTFNRNSIDNNGHSITSYVHWGTNIDNAYFYPGDNTFRFGNGYSVFHSLTALDVVAHELGHGFAKFEVNFNNTGEARSLNEGFSDIWGATIENWSGISGKETWTMGEEIMANGFSCLRSLRNPTGEGWLSGFSSEGHYPDTRLGPNWDVNNADEHINATVLGHWYYLLSQGGSGTNGIGNSFSVNGLGIQTAAQIAYNTELELTPSADFMSVRVASIAYATQQWGANSCQTITVTNAWHAVGVGAAYSGNGGFSISGPSSICNTTETYTISLPMGATVTSWSASPSTAVTISGSGSSVALSKSGNYNGNVTLTATVTMACGTVQVPKKVYVGAKKVFLSGPYDPVSHAILNIAYAGHSYYFVAQELSPPAESGTTYSWTVTPPPGSDLLPMSFSGSQITVNFSIAGTYQLQLDKSNSCGQVSVVRTLPVQDNP